MLLLNKWQNVSNPHMASTFFGEDDPVWLNNEFDTRVQTGTNPNSEMMKIFYSDNYTYC